ncbi:collagen alpha-1(XII) chain isoform X3 [Strongylocentrotus purpuratus]|uniref:Uncharacterized protein n=1 Tax=Strongylocentrotus purpuratus TaxID=7668 RepID=A0A7M7MXT2_STRPU|nr:collagen alpha-1(XII) chain isoform X3 [Strongylocentrotus purpuratus]
MEVSKFGLIWAIVLISMIVAVQGQRKKAGPPLNVQTTGHTQTSVSLAWTAPKKLPVGGHTISGYKILYKQEGQSDASGKKIDVPTDPSYTVTDLAPGTTYMFKIATITSNGKVGGFSSWKQDRTEDAPATPPPDPPSNVQGSADGTNINMEWTPSRSQVDGYVVSYGKNSVDENSMEVSQDQRGATISGLDAGATYQVAVQSVSGGQRSSAETFSATTASPVPSAAGNLRLRSTSDSIDAEWAHNSAEQDGVTGFEVSVGPDSNPTEQTVNLGSSDRFTTVSGLQPDQVYVVSVTAQNEFGSSQPVSDKISTQAASGGGGGGGAANSPPNGMQIREGSDRATVTWEPATNDVDGYNVNMGTEANPNQFTQRVPSGQRRRFKQDGLEPDTDYQVSIKSFDAEGESDPIQQGFRTKPRETRTRGPRRPSGTKVKSRYDSLGVEWEEPEGDDVTGYRLEAGPPSNPRQFTRDFEPGTTSADIPDLTPDTDYQVNLYSTSASGDSEPVRRKARTRQARRPQRPQRTRATSSSTDSIDVNWQAPRDDSVTGYRVDVGIPSDPQRSFSQRYPARTNRASIPGLNENSEYQVSVVSTSESGESEPVRKSVKTQVGDTSRPQSPNGMRVREGTETATVNWEAASGDVDGYVVNMGTEANPNQFTQRVPSSNRRRFRQAGLEPDTDYQVSVKSVKEGRESEPINQGFRTRPRRAEPTRPPTGVRVNTRYDSMGVQWEEPEDENVNGYRLEVGTPDDPQQFVGEYARGTDSAVVPDLDPDTAYQVKLVSTSESGESSPVRRRARTRRNRRPKRPQRTRATSSSPDSIDVNWQDPDDENVDGYRVDVGSPSNPRSKFSQRIPRGTNSVSVPGLDPDSDYQVSVVSTSPSGESEPVRKTASTQRRGSGGVSPPNGMRLNEEPTSVRVNWGASGSDNIDGYTVNIGPPSNPTQFSQNVPKTTTSLRQKGLRPNTDYQASVKAYGSDGESDPLQQGFRTKPKQTRGPKVPVNTRANSRYDAIALRWDEPDDDSVTGYRVEVGTPNEPNQASWNFPRGTRDFTIPDLDPDSDYDVKLYSTSPSGDSEPIRRKGRTRRNRRPRRPARAKVNPSSNSIDVSWDDAKGDNVEGYRLDVGTPSNPRQFSQRFPRDTTRATVPGLDPDTDYQVQIVTNAAGRESEPLTKPARTRPGPSTGGSPGRAADSPPNGMQIREGPDRATVNWEPATNDVDGYVVNMGTEANPNQFTQRVPSSDRRRFKQDGLEPETDYQVSIKSFDSEGESEPIQQGFRTRPRRSRSPQAPTGTKVNRRVDSLGVEWEEPEGDDVTGYRLEAGPPSNPRQFTRDFEPGTTSADIPGLTPDTDYQVNLYSTSRSGDSEPVRRKARTRPTRRPQRPQRTRASSSSPDSIDVNWEAPTDDSVDGFRVDVGTPADPRRDFSRRYPTGTTRASIPNLNPDSQYQVSVVSTSQSGESEPARKPVRTQGDGNRRPSRPNGMQVREGIESATVNWEPATNDVDGYIVNMGTEANPNQFTQRVPSGERRRFRQNGLEPDTDYQVSVKSFDSNGESEPIQRGFRTRPRRPQTTKSPNSVRTKPRYDSMGVQWEEPEDENVDGYRLEVGTPSDPRQFVREFDRGTTAANVPGLDPETDYQVNLVSTSPSGDSEPVRRRARTRRTRRPKRPQRTRATSSRPDSIDVNWQDPDDESVDGYRVDVGTPSNPRSKFSQRIPRGTNSVSVPGLDEDSDYQVSVVSTSPTGESEPVRKSVKTQRSSPQSISSPNSMRLDEEPSSVTVNWDPSGSDNIDGYTVDIGTPSNPTQFSQNVPKTTKSLRQKGLRPSTDYQVSVKAYGSDGESDPIQQGFRTKPKRSRGPAPPVNTKANTRYDSIAVKWDEPDDENVNGYRLEVGTPDEPNQASWNFPRGTRDFTIPDLDPDTDYDVKLYSTSPSGDSEPIRRKGRTRRNRRPKRPARSKVNPSSDSLDVSWDEAKGDNIDGYRVDVGTPSNPRQFTQRVPRGTTRASFPGLDPDTDYQVNIVSTAGVEESEPLTKAARTRASESRPSPGAERSPPNGMQIREGPDRATVNWEPATNDVDGYVVNMGTEANPNQFTQRVPSSDRRRFKQDGLEPETDYQVSIKSFDSEGESEPIQQGFRTRPRRTGSPQPPTGTKVNRRVDSLGVEWEEPEGDDVTGYRLEAGPPSNPRQFTRDFEPGTTSADIPGLTPDTDYQVNLYSTSRTGDSEPIRRNARTRPTRRPQRPQRTRASSSSPDSIDVNWEAPTDDSVDGFRVDVGTPADPRRDFSRRYPTGTTRASIPNLNPDSQYQVSVVSTSPSGESEPARKPVRTQGDGNRRPSRPNGMQVREGIESATVNWEPATNDVDGYIVNMGTEANPNQFTQRVPSGERRRFRQNGLEPDTDYQVSVKSFDSNGESEPIQRGFRTRPRRPQTTKSPNSVRTKPRYDSMGVQWEEPEDENVDGYRLEVGTPSDPRQFVREFDRGTTAANVPGLDPETDYQVNLVSTSPSGDSEPVRRRARTRRTRRPQRPQRTRATSSSPDSIDVNWQDPDDESVDGYRVDVGTPSNPRSKFSQRIPRGTNSVSVPGLDEDSEYQVSVVSTSPTGESDPVRKSVRTQRPSPQSISSPNGMRLDEESSSVTVNWDPSGSDNIDGYTVNTGTPSNPTQFSENVPKTTTSLRQKGLRPSTDYQVSVKAYGSDGESDPIQQGFRTKPKRSRGPKAPTNTKANTRYDSIAVKWDEPEDDSVTGYRMEVGTPDEPNQASWNFPRGTRDFTIPDLDPDTDYQVKLYSTSPSGDSEPITRRGRTRRNRLPKRPARSRVNPSSDSLDVSWDEAKGDNIDGYRVDVGTPSNPRQFTQRIPRGTTRASFPGLDPDTDYQVNIVSTAGVEESEPLTKAARTRAAGSRPSPGGAANSPPNGMQIREGSDRATVNWEPATNDVDGYVVNMGTEANPNQFTQRVPSSERRRFRQDGLEPETDYQVSIKSFDSEGESEPIQQGFRTRPRQSTSPKPPTGTRVNRRYDSLGVEWEEPEGDDVEGYRLEVGTPSNPRQFTRDYERGTTSADIPGLTPDTDYQVNLVSTSPSGESEPVRRSARTRPTRRPQRPQRTRATSSRPDSIDVNWEDPDDENVDGYRVDVGTPSDPRSMFSQRIPRGTNSVNVPGLDPDSDYQVSVVSTSPTGESEPVRKSAKTRRSGSRGSSPPNGLRLNEDADSVDINWGPSGSDNIEGYIVNVGPPDNPTQFSERVPKTTSFRQTGLRPDRDYQVSVQAYGPDGESEPVRQGFRTQPSRSRSPRRPVNTKANPRYDSIAVRWDEPEDDSVTGYRMEVGTPSDPNQFSMPFPRGTRDFTIPDLDPSTDYQVKLYSTSPSGDSDPVTRRARTRKNRLPKKPSPTRVTPGDDSIDVTWGQPEGSNIAGYRLDVGTPSNPQQFSRRLPADARSLSVDGLDPDTDYQVNLVSTSPDGESEPVTRQTRTGSAGDETAQPGIPETPSGVDVTSEGNNLRVSWNPQEGATGYIVRAGRASRGFPPNEVEERVNSRKDQILLRNLQPDTDFVVTVSSVNQAGESRPARATGRTEQALPGRPEGLAAETTSTSATLSWREPGTLIDGYQLTLGTVTFPDIFSKKLGPNTNEYTFEDLDPDTIYTAELTSLNSAGSSMPISAKLRTEPGPARSPPEAPSRMELTATPSRINIQWEPSRGDTTGYRIRLTDPATGETDTVEVDQFQQSYAFVDLDPEKQYEVSIESFNDEGYSRPQVDRVTTGALPGGSEQPQNVDIVATGTRIDAHWNPPVLPGNARPHSYLVIAEAVDGEGNVLGPRESITLHHSQTEYTFTDLLPATRYVVSVHANIGGEVTNPISQEVITTMDGPIPPINIMAEPISPEAISVSWDFPVETGPPPEIGGRRPDIYYTVRVSNPDVGDVYANSREMTADVEGLTPDTLYDVQVAMVYNGFISDYGDRFSVRTFSDVDPRSPQFPTVTQVLLESADNVHATLNWLPPREDADNVRSYNTEYTMAEDPTLEDVEWDSVSSDPSDLGVVVSDLPTNGVVHHRTQPVYQGGEKGPFSVIQSFSTPVAERPTPEDQPCQSHEDVTHQRINQITERTVPPLGMPLPYCDQFFTDFPCVWSPVCICIPRGTKSLGALPTSIRPASGPGCSSAQQQRDDPSAMYRDEPRRISEIPSPCQAVFDVTLEAIKESHKNAIPLMASSLPSCSVDGYYNSIQCMGTMCLCVDRMGEPTGEMTEVWNVKKLRCT